MKETKTSTQLVRPEHIARPHYVQPSGLTRADARRICEANGVIWGC